MAYGFIKTACVSPQLKVADCKFNAEQIVESAGAASKKGASILVFPELSITGYTCGDLFFNRPCFVRLKNSLLRLLKRQKSWIL